jgi:hypothetical protein
LPDLEVYFDRLTGRTIEASLILSDTKTGESKSLTIDANGNVELTAL